MFLSGVFKVTWWDQHLLASTQFSGITPSLVIGTFTNMADRPDSSLKVSYEMIYLPLLFTSAFYFISLRYVYGIRTIFQMQLMLAFIILNILKKPYQLSFSPNPFYFNCFQQHNWQTSSRPRPFRDWFARLLRPSNTFSQTSSECPTNRAITKFRAISIPNLITRCGRSPTIIKRNSLIAIQIQPLTFKNTKSSGKRKLFGFF